MMRRVFITTWLPTGTQARLAAACEPVLSRATGQAGDPTETPPTRAELIRGASGCFGLVCTGKDLIDGPVLDATGVRIVASVGDGLDHIDLEAARARRVWVTHTPGVAVDAVADLTLTLMLGLSRRLFEAERSLRGSQLIPALLGTEPRQKTLGIVGLGRVGRAVARRARAFGMRVLHHRGNADGVTAERRDLEGLLRESDLVSLHARLTPATVGLIGARELALMRPQAVLVNTARAALVDPDALVQALESGALGGYALDTGGAPEREPPSRGIDPRLLAFERVVVTPRLGAATHEARVAARERAADQILAALSGLTPPDRAI